MAITYAPTTNFGLKDSLPTNDSDKVIRGSEFTTEFTAIQTAFSLAAPNASPTFTGTVTIPTADINGGNIDGTVIGAATPAAGSFTNLTATGTTTLAGASTTADITFGDNDKAIFGAGSDLQIYHDGSHSYISDQGTGQLRILASQFQIMNAAGTESMVFGAQDNTATLYYDNSAKLATTATGIDVTGTVTADGLTVDNSGTAISITNGDGLTQLGKFSGEATDGFVIEGKVNNNLTLRTKANTAGEGIKFQDSAGDNMMFIDGTTGDISFYEDTGTTPKFFWDASAETLTVGGDDSATSSGLKSLILGEYADSGSGVVLRASSASAINFEDSNASTAGRLYYNHTSDYMSFNTANTERARLDASGNLLVGTTDSNVTNNSGNNPGINIGVAGIKGYMAAARYQGNPLSLNRLNNDGDIVTFQKDGSTVGSIGTTGGDLTIGTGITTLKYVDALDTIHPNGTGSGSDGNTSLGWSNNRFKDIYATNAIIQTSDANEKQDIAELDEAERRVAVAAKSLLRKFRWKDSVAEKGDEARIHFGIIAQDLQAAFEAEGLDAGRYAMFIHSTWTDEETGEERSRMGVRYSELFAFIIAAL